MSDSNQQTMKHLVTRGLLAGGLIVCLHVAQTAWAADPSDPTPPESPSVPSTPPARERDGSMRAGMQKFRQACEADIKQFCGNVQPGGGRIIQCLESHSKEVSEQCHETLEKRGQRGPR